MFGILLPFVMLHVSKRHVTQVNRKIGHVSTHDSDYDRHVRERRYVNNVTKQHRIEIYYFAYCAQVSIAQVKS